jgi:Helix-turn-helix domain
MTYPQPSFDVMQMTQMVLEDHLTGEEPDGDLEYLVAQIQLSDQPPDEKLKLIAALGRWPAEKIANFADDLRQSNQQENYNRLSHQQKDEQSKQFQRVMFRTWSIRHPDMEPVHKLILMAILRYCRSFDHCQVSQEYLADDCCISVKTLQRRLPDLERWG